MPGGFHPFHAGHAALYNSIRRAFPGAEVYVAATNDTSTRPFPFAVKEKLAKLAGVEPGHFVQVKSPFRAEEITAQFDPAKDQLIFVRSEKDAAKPPQPGGVKKNGEPAYLQPFRGARKLEPFGRHAYMAYLPTVEFAGGKTSATEIRAEWPTLDEQGKLDRVMSLYPRTQNNPRLAATVVKLLDTAIQGEVAENQGWAATYNESDMQIAGTPAVGGMWAGYQQRENQPVSEKAKSKPRDAELIRAMQYIKQHYPTYSGEPDLAMAKWVQRSLRHSEENDQRHDAALRKLSAKIDQIAADLNSQPLDEGMLKNLALAGAIGLGSLGLSGTAIAQDVPVDQPVAVQQVQKIDYTKPGPVTKDSMGQKLEYGVPVTDQGKFKAPNIDLPDEEYQAQLRAYKKWRADFTARWPSAKFAPDGSVLYNIKPGLAAPSMPFAKMNEADYIEEKWSEKYKRSINCANPRGFSQRAHCQGRRKK